MNQQDALREVVDIWAELLGIAPDDLRPMDNFYERNGDSFAAIMLCAKIKERFNREMTLRDLAIHPTLRALADWLCEAEPDSAENRSRTA